MIRSTRETPSHDDDQSEGTWGDTDQADLASASRSCSVILVLMALLVLFLCLAFAISQLA
ncbi:MAG: hypothetical protein KatS3mg059_0977 [Thermomicrobiales bacterium]|nr:MAG: hypothetical protein KatS3mg059_0977 [Thermomicrobiales bacterium]